MFILSHQFLHMKKMMSISLLIFTIAMTNSYHATAQTNLYKYSVDLTKVNNDQLTVELITPAVSKKDITYYFPKIVPGTYMNSNYGKYVHDLKAFDKNGVALKVKQTGDNSWEIKDADRLNGITYNVEDTWDSDIRNKVYTMCGTSFEAGKNFLINTPGLFGYFDGMKNLQYELNFKKPAGFYAATGLKPAATSNTTDQFICSNTDELYDSPLMFSLPDTASVRVGNTDV